jgi:Putative zinc-finger
MRGGPVIRERDQPPPSSDKYVTWDAAYVLGSLSAAERREYEGHLRNCPNCQAAVGDLAGMPGLMGLLTHDDLESIDELSTRGGAVPAAPPIRPELLDNLLHTVRRRRRRTRVLAWTGGCAAAAAAVAIGLFLILRPTTMAPTPPPQAAAPALTMAPVKPSEVTATVRLVSHDWGTAIEMNCLYGAESAEAEQDPDVDTLAMVAVGRDGSRARLATWTARTGVLASPTGSTSLPINDIASVQIVAADTGDVLLQRSP